MSGQFNYFLPDFFYSVKVPNHQEIKDKIYPKLLTKDTHVPWAECNVKSSYKKNNSWLSNDPLISDLVWNTYDELLAEDFIANSIEYKHPIRSDMNAWFNLYDEGDFQEIHNHVLDSTTYSFIYVIHDESTTGLNFISSNPNILTYSRKRSVSTKDIGIHEGYAVIFPAYLDHSVSPVTGKRATITANIRTISRISNN